MDSETLAFSNSLPLRTRRLRVAVNNSACGEHRSYSRQATRMCDTMPPQPSARLEAFLHRAEEGAPLRGLTRAEAAFASLKQRAHQNPTEKPQVSEVVSVSETMELGSGNGTMVDYDVVVAGGTLGVIYATALQRRGWRVAVVERGIVQGRVQEWNISRSELTTLVENDVLTQEQLEEAITTECDEPGRAAFKGRGGDMRSVRVQGVLDVGVSPNVLVDHVKRNFAAADGTLLERHALRTVRVAPDCVRLALRRTGAPAVAGALGAGGTGLDADSAERNAEVDVSVTARLLIDAMGGFSPIAEQARNARPPDGVCITVGACIAADWPQPLHAPDVIVSSSPVNAERSAQYFWEAFPVGNDERARTTYMFSYGVCDERRQTLTEMLEDYVEALETYQGLKVTSEDKDEMNLRVKRVLFGFFPSYFRSAPTRVAFDRVLPVGDAGGLQSPISFGGFGCCVRHLPRISRAVDEALRGTANTTKTTTRDRGDQKEKKEHQQPQQHPNDVLLNRHHLQMIQWYLPSLSATGLFHKAMSVEPGNKTAGRFMDEYGINDLLWSNMKAMEIAGKQVQQIFLRDVVTAGGISKTLAIMAFRNPILSVRLTGAVGLPELFRWLRHYIALIGYAAALPVVRRVRDWAVDSGAAKGKTKFWLNRMVDGITYGCGADAHAD